MERDELQQTCAYIGQRMREMKATEAEQDTLLHNLYNGMREIQACTREAADLCATDDRFYALWVIVNDILSVTDRFVG